jgi:hypothetical protein
MRKASRSRSVGTSSLRLRGRGIGLVLLLALVVGCGAPPARPSPVPTAAAAVLPTALALTPAPTVDSSAGLAADEVATLGSLEKVDDYPLYTMRYFGSYEQGQAVPAAAHAGRPAALLAWACSLFAALGDSAGMVYGRNFDWEYSPALLLFTDPPDGYASVSLVDIAYLGFGKGAGDLTDLPLGERRALLQAPFLPFDGMNELGLVVGMAAVPEQPIPPSADKETVDSLLVIRRILDHAGDVDEAVALLGEYNIDWGSGPALHYLIADASGRAVVVEFYQGQMVVLRSERPWHVATNFLLSAAGASPHGQCWRYDSISQRLEEAAGRLTAAEAMDLLASVSQDSTQWSIVYGMTRREVTVSMGRRYESRHTFSWGLPDVP